MGDPKGFMKIKRTAVAYRPVRERIGDFSPVALLREDSISEEQASRCMDCGTPFCHGACPLGNLIPEWNDLVFRGRWERALELLSATNNLPEVTGRICPALCEYACVLGINDDPVTARENELGIVEYGFKKGLIRPRRVQRRTGRNIAVIGSGPAGLACADQLNRAGHRVTVFERDTRCGGILRYGIPDFKLDKRVLDRRLKIWEREGIRFRAGTHAGVDVPAAKIIKGFDAVCLAGGSRQPRDLAVAGRELKGIHFAMEYLIQSNRRAAGEHNPADIAIDASGKSVVVIGGGDTGADCVGTAHRQGASCVTQVEVLVQPPACRPASQPWPAYPQLLKQTTSHEEGGERQWSVLTKRFIGEKGHVKALDCVRVEFVKDAAGCMQMTEIPGSEFILQADLVILAVGFVHPEHKGLLAELGVAFDQRGNVRTDEKYHTSVKKVFCAGDMRRGQSLVVWAVSEGRKAARAIDEYLMGTSRLPQT
ncbi:MAG: glutamate synthase subunit beta [Candidatus Omnitrophica bacterium]|nr:glutamate synthase subunit beta [Candidatus Omnitrophota bacterium]